MRLYINPKEIAPLKRALRISMGCSNVQLDVEEWEKVRTVFDRIEICEELQQNCVRSAENG